VASKVFNLQKIHGKKGTDITNVDANWIKLYWGHWQKQTRHRPFNEFKHASNAVIEHLFNDHTFCTDEWCPVLKAQAKQHEYKGVYRSKEKHAREYEQIQNALAPYLTDNKLKEIHHPYDSQKNESFNKSATKYAPKGRTYAMTMALTARISIAAGVCNLGAQGYWTRVFECLQIEKGEHTEAFLLDKTRRSKHKHEYQCRIPVRRRRREKISFKWQEILKKQFKEEQSGITYKSGVRNDGDAGEKSKALTRLNKTAVVKKACARCGRWDHRKLCKWCPQSKEYAPEFDALYTEWEACKRSKGEIPDSNVGHSQNLDELNQDSS
jgi:hypothetical protein